MNHKILYGIRNKVSDKTINLNLQGTRERGEGSQIEMRRNVEHFTLSCVFNE
jgi:hypothetical protein